MIKFLLKFFFKVYIYLCILNDDARWILFIYKFMKCYHSFRLLFA